MDQDIHEQFRGLRKAVQVLRSEVREDIRGLHAKLDVHIDAISARCAERGEELAVLMNRERQRERSIDRRIAAGLLIITVVSVLLRFAL